MELPHYLPFLDAPQGNIFTAACLQETKRKARPSCQAVLDRFDEQYSQELGDLWESAR